MPAAPRGNDCGMGVLTVSRPSDWGGRFRKLKIVVDGEVVAALRPNEQWQTELSEGTHTVSGRMDWASSPPLEVAITSEGLAHVEVSLPYLSVLQAFVTPRRAVKARLL